MTSDEEPRRFFFLHIMKTGGGTFSWYLRNSFEPGQVYPDDRLDTDLGVANRRIDYLLGLPPERHAPLRVYTGHFTHVASELLEEQLGTPLTRMVILRDPVDRTISYLKHCTIHHDRHRGLPLEEVYEDEFFFPGFIHDHQTKVLSLTRDDPVTTFFQALDVDEDRLARACDVLDAYEVVGITERFEDLVTEVRRRYGWGPLKVPDQHVSDGDWDVSDALRERIANDNAIDLALYDHARRLVEARATPRSDT